MIGHTIEARGIQPKNKATVSGQIWKIELFQNNLLKIEKLVSEGSFYDDKEIENMLEDFGT